MDIKEILYKMKHTPWNWYYVCDTVSQPNRHWQNSNGATIQPSEIHWEEYNERREQLDYIGSDICSVLMPIWWVGIDEYDFESIDRHTDALLKGHPDRFFVPRIKMDAPLAWQKEHPEELCVYFGGPTTAQEIRDMVGTSFHDRFGWDDDRKPHPDQRISNQSFSSTIWLEDASKALAALIDHYENGPYAKQILGYMPAFGNCGECMWWGDWRNQGDPRKGDFGISHKKHFYDWAISKYGDLEKLRKAWNIPTLTFETLTMPTPFERWSEGGKNIRQVFLADDQRQVDCNEFHSKCCFDAIETFGKVVKEKSNKASGCFYGYFQDETVGYAGHLAIERALNTPYVDFYSSPKGYHFCLAGDPGSSQAPAQSFARKKLWIEENDLRSHHAADLIRATGNAQETQTVFWREIYRALTFNFGFWWMDIGGLTDDWYADDEMVKMFKDQADFYKKWSPIPRRSVAQVLFVEDEDSCMHTTYLSGIQRGLRLRLERELRLCGMPMDHLRVDDMLEMDTSQYKFIVFCHAFVMSKEKMDKILARINPKAHILFNYGAGLLSPSYDNENQRQVTGFETYPTPDRMHHSDLYRHVYWHTDRKCPQDYPLLSLKEDTNYEVLQRSPDGYLLTARTQRGEGKNIFACDITLRARTLRKLLQDANVDFLAPENCSVLADDKLIGFFPRFDSCFEYDFVGKWQNAITKEVVSGKTKMFLREKTFALFEKLD